MLLKTALYVYLVLGRQLRQYLLSNIIECITRQASYGCLIFFREKQKQHKCRNKGNNERTVSLFPLFLHLYWAR